MYKPTLHKLKHHIYLQLAHHQLTQEYIGLFGPLIVEPTVIDSSLQTEEEMHN